MPERYREPLVLCYLAGLTYEQAAAALKCPVRTVQTRLIRGRERLRGRLTRRGLGPPAGLLGAAVVAESARASVPAALAEITSRSAVSFAAAQASGTVSVSAASLAEGVLRTMLLNKIKLVMATTALGVVATSAVILVSGVLQAQVAPKRAAPAKGTAAPRDDLAVLQGKWSATLAAPNGENMTVVWTIEGNSLALGFLRPGSKSPVVVKGRIQIDSKTKPRSFAIVNATGPDGNPQKDNLGIYEIEGDTLKVCYGTPGNPRPITFEAGELGPPMVMTLKRGGPELNAQAPANAALPTEPVEVSGRVQAPDGRPYSGAKIYFFRPDDALPAEEPRVVDPEARAVRATSGPDGTFKFQAVAGDFAGVVRAYPTSQPTISAVAQGYGPGWVCCASAYDATDVTLKLVKDDVPISGRVLNLEGRAVAEATAHIMGVYALQAENPAPIVKIFQRSPAPADVFQCLEKQLDQSVSGLPESVRTGSDGRFRLKGAGRGRVVLLRIDGPRIATQNCVYVLANASPLLNAREAIKKTAPEVTFSMNPSFEIFAEPTQPIVGVVRDKDIGKPIAGVVVKSNSLANVPVVWNDFVRTTTDGQGRYRLVGLPKGPGHTIMAVPPDGDPHLAALADTGRAPFSEPVKVDFNLKRGILIKGRVTAHGSGLPVRGRVEYFAAWSNPTVNDFPGFLGTRRSVPTRADGSFAVAGVPGEGMLGVRAEGDGFPTVNKLCALANRRKSSFRHGPIMSSRAGFTRSLISRLRRARLNLNRTSCSIKPAPDRRAGRREAPVVAKPNREVPSDAWAAYQPDERAPWNRRRVVHLHRRAGFAATPTEIKRDLADGPVASIDRLLAGKGRGECVPDGFESTAARLADAAAGSRAPSLLKAWWVYRMMFGPDPLGERLTLLWHDHFATSNLKVDDVAAMRRQNDVMREHARAPFGALLDAMVRDPALLIWLDAPSNRRGRPNENLARELLELFTLGIGPYSELDVKQTARALTGWTVADRTQEMMARQGSMASSAAMSYVDRYFREELGEHDAGEKTILGRTGRWSGKDLVRILLEHPATSQRLAWRLSGMFMGEGAVDGSAIRALADGLKSRDLDIGWGVATVLRSRAFFAAENLGTRVADPAVVVIGAVRALELAADAPSTLSLAEWMGRMGQELFYPPNVGGWPGGRAWLAPGGLIVRANYAAAVALGTEIGLAGPLDVTALLRAAWRAR